MKVPIIPPQGEELLNEQMLRGSCPTLIRKFDYAALRNTAQFNQNNKGANNHEVRRSPQE